VNNQEAIEKLVSAFPRRVVAAVVALHNCPRCQALREQLTGRTWPEIPAEFIRDHSDVLPLLSHEAYLAFLPAWLQRGILEPDGDVAGMLLVNLGHKPDTSGFTPEQREAIIVAARFITQNDYWGPEDPENVKSLEAIERIWQETAACSSEQD
jgi:hypothetical protein